ncbi:mucin-5AC-like isoform X3 [Bombus pascuorum]|uniref:mucin-5AC-like isoform X3 n=1 Tax=Bombus pascuorum TaxID=65598 RepID=UPI0021422CAA|nr:mucin-5AC-like isoform X3 [Bombus pascuorum]
MWIKFVLLISCTIANTLADNGPRSKAVSIEEFVTSHKVPENIARPSDYDEDDDDVVDVERKTISKHGKHTKKVIPKFESFDKKPGDLDPVRRFDFVDEDKATNGNNAKRQVRVELENFGDTGILQEDGIRRSDTHRSRLQSNKDSVIPGVHVSDEYSTTMMPVLTTPREARAFDFVPVNIIRDDGKETSFHERNFGDFSDVSLVPAGTNSRIQVKKGPNGKDYEYETTSSPRRGGSSANRSKYSNVERSSTVEPASNEVIPNRNNNRGRQLVDAEDISEERLPTNTRFPPRSRSNHNTATTEPSRTRGNRPRPGLDLVDSSSFRTHQEGPEFPQVLPKGPVRFLGVTPNEDNGEERATARGRGRPQRVQEPAPVEELVEDVPAPTTRRRPITTMSPQTEGEAVRGSSRGSEEKEEQTEETPTEKSRDKQPSLEKQEYEDSDSSSTTSASTASTATEDPTTEYPSSMDKVALDLYAFVQQGQNNLVDASSSEATDSSSDESTISNDEATTDLAAVTEMSATTVTLEPTTITTAASPTEPMTTTVATTTTVSTTTTTTTTTTEPPTTTTTQAPAGRGKFRRPGIGGTSGSRNRFKSNGGGSTTTTEAPAEPTQRTRNRFGGNGSNGGGFKRNRPGQKQASVEEDAVQKESSSSVHAERPSSSTRSRFRGTGSTRSVSSTTPATSNGGSTAASNGSSGISRSSFNKLNINRRRGRPTTNAPNASEESQESTRSETAKETAQESVTTAPKSTVRGRLPATGVRPVIKPGARINLRSKPGHSTTTTTTTPLPVDKEEESSIDEPAGEGTEEETHEAPAETSPPPTRSTTVNPLNKLRNRNRLQVHPKTTTRAPVSLASRRSPLLPRRKVTEAPVAQSSQEETSEEADSSSETEATEATSAETSTAASTKHEETRGLGGLLAPRRRITPRRPGQIISRE